MNDLVLVRPMIESMLTLPGPSTLVMTWRDAQLVVNATPLITKAVYLNAYIKRSCLSDSMYIIRLDLRYCVIYHARVPSRVRSFNVEMTCITNINTFFYRLNVKRKDSIRIPKTILDLNISQTEIRKSPSGYFIALAVGSGFTIRCPKPRESIILFTSYRSSLFKWRFAPKTVSIIETNY